MALVEQEPEACFDSSPLSFERVIVELVWYDGERAGIANIDGVPHYFRTDDYIHPPDEVPFLTWPVDQDTLQLEIECYRIFVTGTSAWRPGK